MCRLNRASPEGRLPAAPLTSVFLVWGLYLVVGAAVFATYARLPADRLYHVSGSGIAGGAGRALVFLGFPVSLGAIAIG
jgi:hypothetical protein